MAGLHLHAPAAPVAMWRPANPMDPDIDIINCSHLTHGTCNYRTSGPHAARRCTTAQPVTCGTLTMQLQNKNILLGVSGGIAAYKTCTLIRLLMREGAEVRVIMTEGARHFVHENTFAALSGHDVLSGLFEHSAAMEHVGMGKSADLMVIAPATANTVAKLACGMADNLLTATALACRCRVLLAPAMNEGMYRHPATQANLKLLAERGCIIAGPRTGELACGDSGPGRMEEPEELLRLICALLTDNVLEYQRDSSIRMEQQTDKLTFQETLLLASASAASLRVLITAGPTREYLDPVRYLSNESSGLMGYSLAQAAVQAGAEVTLVSGPVSLTAPAGAALRRVISAEDMYDACMDELQRRPHDIVIATAAVSDFRPLQRQATKISKTAELESLEVVLIRNRDLIASIANLEHRPFCVGFAAETDHHKEHALRKLADKHLDLIVLNDVSREDIGFNSSDNAVDVYGSEGLVERFGRMPKAVLGLRLFDLIVRRFSGSSREQP